MRWPLSDHPSFKASPLSADVDSAKVPLLFFQQKELPPIPPSRPRLQASPPRVSYRTALREHREMTRPVRFVLDDDDDDDHSDEDSVPSQAPTPTPRATPTVVVSSADGPRDAEKTTASDGGGREKGSHEASDDRGRSGGKGSATFPPDTPPEKEQSPPSEPPKQPRKVPDALAWIPPHLNWKGWRPVIRASVAAWCGLLLLLGSKSEAVLGQASFLVLIVATISPAALPIASQLEQTFFQAVFVAIGWAWSCLGLFIAHEARSIYRLSQADFNSLAAGKHAGMGLTAAQISSAVSEDIFHGLYLEPASSAVCAVFLSVGCGFFLWLRGYLGPGPAVFGLIFGIIMQAITLTIGPLFPYAYYGIGIIFYLPFICQLAINVACTFVVFPETLAHQFSDRLINVLTPLQTVIASQEPMLQANPRTEEWLKFKSVKAGVNSAMGGLALLSASEANLSREVSFGLVSGKDLTKILATMRVLVSRSTGFVSFYEIVEKHLHRDESDAKGGPIADALTIHLGHSRPASAEHTPATSPSTSRASLALDPPAPHPAPSPVRASFTRSASAPMQRDTSSDHSNLHEQHDPQEYHGHHPSPLQSLHNALDRHAGTQKKRARSHHRGHHSTSASHVSIPSLLHEVLHPNIDIRPVGVLESQRYMDLEDYMHNPRDEQHIEEIITLLSTASSPLLDALTTATAHLITTIHTLKANDAVYSIFLPSNAAKHEAATAKTAEILKTLEDALSDYRDSRRLDVVRPFAPLFDPVGHREGAEVFEAPSHRGCFWAFSYQFSLIGWAMALIEVFRETAEIEKKRRKARVWTPDWAKVKFRSGAEDAGNEDERPTDVPGFQSTVPGFDRSVFSAARDPDYVPPSKRSHIIGVSLYGATHIFRRSDFWWGVKVALLIGLISLPAYFQSTAYFFYRERGVWVLIMAALTSTQYVGDTTFNFVVRVFGTFAGAVIGMVIWYIGAGQGTGSPYGIAAVSAVALPFIMYFRLQDANQPALSSVGWGWDVAWRRFVCVLIGITAAWLWAYLPPTSTQKETVRMTYAKVIGETGGVLCQVLSFANCKEDGAKPPKQIIANISALRAKVAATTPRKAMIQYEISLRGPWPAGNYDALQALQLEILDLLGQLLGVFASLDSKWTKALLHRGQLSDSRFLGEVLNTFQLIATSLNDSKPLPMLFNPLLELFLRPSEAVRSGHAYGFDVTMDEPIRGIPLHVDLTTICSIEYLRFSCGISQCYAIVNRLDRLMFVAKSLVGENYIVYGLPSSEGRVGEGSEPLLRQRWLGDESARNSLEV